jgi:hypothetical protein
VNFFLKSSGQLDFNMQVIKESPPCIRFGLQFALLNASSLGTELTLRFDDVVDKTDEVEVEEEIVVAELVAAVVTGFDAGFIFYIPYCS